MKTHDLATELDGLARQLRSLSCEASTAVAETLLLDRRRFAGEPRAKFAAPLLTVRDIAQALAGATRQCPARSIELRKDVFDRRIENLAATYTDRFEAAIRRGAAAPAGELVYGAFRHPPGTRYYYDCLPGFCDRSPLSAEFHAWMRATRFVMARLVPSYGRACFEKAARALAMPPAREYWEIASEYDGKRDAWAEQNTIFRCTLDAAGKVTAVHGVDPAPFIALLAQVTAGQLDPVGVFGPAPLPAPVTAVAVPALVTA